MTNKKSIFTPRFSSTASDDKKIFTAFGDSVRLDADSFTERGSLSENVKSSSLQINIPSFNDLTSDIDAMLMDSSERDTPPLDSLIAHDMISSEKNKNSNFSTSLNLANNADLFDLLAGDQEEQMEISGEVREAIYAEGYMAGSIDQKAVQEKRLAELKSLVTEIKIAASTPASLSQDITSSISSFVKKITLSLLTEDPKGLLGKIIESRVSEFVADVKSWELNTSVYCSQVSFHDLQEIFDLDDGATAGNGKDTEEVSLTSGRKFFLCKEVYYRLDANLSEGCFRIEIEREDAPKLEGGMDLNSHFDSIMATFEDGI